jgi:hypothetical protein
MSAPRPEESLEAQTTTGLGGKEPNMLIIDSLLKFNFFLSGEVQENLSLFSVSQAQAAMPLPAMSTDAQHSFDPSYG